MSDILWPLVTLCIALLAYHTVSKSIQLKHGLMLAADRAQAQDRALTALELKSKRHADELAAAFTRLDGLHDYTRKLSESVDQHWVRTNQLDERFNVVEARSEGTTLTVTNFINETRDQIVGIQQRETMALAGLNAIGRKGIRTGTP